MPITPEILQVAVPIATLGSIAIADCDGCGKLICDTHGISIRKLFSTRVYCCDCSE